MGAARYQRLLFQDEPISVQGQTAITTDRKVVWKNACVIGEEQRECLVEMSRTKLKFYIVALDLETRKFHVIEMWKTQAKNILNACENSMEKLMTFLEFRYGKLQIKDHDLLL